MEAAETTRWRRFVHKSKRKAEGLLDLVKTAFGEPVVDTGKELTAVGNPALTPHFTVYCAIDDVALHGRSDDVALAWGTRCTGSSTTESAMLWMRRAWMFRGNADTAHYTEEIQKATGSVVEVGVKIRD
ncbi:hypothetical protein R1sor_012290 [Riccia sorocarpa]|uniref:Uncharacterized protein n=1 Tax=Riccia sorocarpa TaxID=122646 RepID=A0ABD3I573_9MARC